jgi:hypothetical protein
MAAVSDREPPVRLRGLTGYRYLLAVLVLVALATVPMVLAIAAGQATLARSPAPAVEPFVPPAGPDVPADWRASDREGDTGWSPSGGSRMLW